MSKVTERQAVEADVRKLPITAPLKALMLGAAEAAGIDEVVVFSGGQYPNGTPGQSHVGSPRHDNGYAADVRLLKDGRVLDFSAPGTDRDLFAAFAKGCAARGATGIGAAVGYMGPEHIHVGFGTRAVWGTNGSSAGAPAWLVDAVEAGWREHLSAPATLKAGDTGPAVENLQQALKGLGYDPGAIDGDFGDKTERAVIAFQQSHALKTDGVAGPNTLAALKIA